MWKNPTAAVALRLLLLTGCRLGEILNLQWKRVDLERRLLRLPDSKTGPKIVYLSEFVLTVLTTIERSDSNAYVRVGGARDRAPLLDAGRPAKANLSIDAGLLAAMDEAAAARGLTRSAFLASAARDKIESRS